MIGAGCDSYAKDSPDKKHPPSCLSKNFNGTGTVSANNRGPSGKVTAAGGGRSLLVDYLVGPSDYDGVDGPGMRVGGGSSNELSFGKKTEPYNGLDEIDIRKIVDISGENYAFTDPWGNDIYYYRLSLQQMVDSNTNKNYFRIHPNDNTWLGNDQTKDGPSVEYKKKLAGVANQKMREEGMIFEYILLTKSNKESYEDWDEFEKTDELYLKKKFSDLSNITENLTTK